MNYKLYLQREYFSKTPTVLLENTEFTVTAFKYSSGIEGIEVKNTRGRFVVLPFMGQMIWDLEFDGISLKMKNMFSQPKMAECIVDTYGCFAFHSGLLANGCPSPQDTHKLHGEMPCASIDETWLEIEESAITVASRVEYVQGFGHHYLAQPRVSLDAGSTKIKIGMSVKNLAGVAMPLQYMCHMNYAYVEHGKIKSNLPEEIFRLRESVPAHVKPTPVWLAYNEQLKKMQQDGLALQKLENAEMYDPEIVFMADKLDEVGTNAVFEIESPKGYSFVTEFSTQDFPSATRWLLYNSDQQVAAFVLPATCRPEGFLAAEKAGTLIWLEAGEERSFFVKTGKK